MPLYRIDFYSARAKSGLGLTTPEPYGAAEELDAGVVYIKPASDLAVPDQLGTYDVDHRKAAARHPSNSDYQAPASILHIWFRFRIEWRSYPFLFMCLLLYIYILLGSQFQKKSFFFQVQPLFSMQRNVGPWLVCCKRRANQSSKRNFFFQVQPLFSMQRNVDPNDWPLIDLL